MADKPDKLLDAINKILGSKDDKKVYYDANGIGHTTELARDNANKREAKKATTKAEQQELSIKAAIGRYTDLLSQWGVKGTAKEAAALYRFIKAQANKVPEGAAPQEATFKQMFTQKFYKLYLTSFEGQGKLADVKASLQSLMGPNYLQYLKDNKEYAAVIKQYVTSPQQVSQAHFEQMIRKTKTWQTATTTGDLKYFNEFTKSPTSSSQSMIQNVADYNAYKTAFETTMSRYNVNPNGEERLFFASHVNPEDFVKSYTLYQTDRQAWEQVMGRQMTSREYQTTVYGKTAGELGFEPINPPAGPPGSPDNDTGKSARTQAQLQASLTRANDVATAIQQYNPSLNWATGQGLSQEQKQNLLFEQGTYQADKAKLAAAFSLQKSFLSGQQAGFALSKTGNQIQQRGI